MKNKKRILSMLLAVSLTASLMTGCGSKDAVKSENPSKDVSVVGQSLKDGTYTGTGNGFNGEMSLEVVVKDGKIEDIIMGDHGESSPVFTRAFPVMKERIMENQTPIVDSVSAATFSSYGLKSAVAVALKEAGADFGEITFTTAPERPAPVELEEVKTQLVVVGGGPSGLAAAISAKQSGVEDVVLVEKLDILSGNGKFDMNFYDTINSKAQKDKGIELTVEDFIEMKKNTNDSDARKQVWAEGTYEVDEWFRDMGINLNFPYGETNHMAEANEYAGEHIQDNLEKKAYELGVDIRTGTKGLDLIMEDGKAVGVKVENREGFYDIKADAVIVATGGFSANKELLAKFAPGGERVSTSNQMGATGDFISIFEENDFQLNNMDILRVFKIIIKNRRDLTGGGNNFILVNENGERFVAENGEGLEFAHAILDQPNGKAFYIYDQPTYESHFRLQKHNELGYHFKANTLEELAKMLEIDGANFIETVDIFNKAVKGEVVDMFMGEDTIDTPLSEEGPYYGVQVESAIHMTKGGVVANEKAQIMTAANEPVEGLYAAGEVTDISGGYNSSVIFGRVSGQEVAEYILEK